MLAYKAELDEFSFLINNNENLFRVKEKYGKLLTKNYIFYLHSELAFQSDEADIDTFVTEALHSTSVFQKLNEAIRGAHE